MKFLGIGLNYLVLLLILHYFGLYGNGELADFIAEAKAVMILLIFGIDVVLVKKLNYQTNENSQIIATTIAFAINVLIAGIIYLIGQLIFDFKFTVFIGGVLLASWRYISNFFRGKNNMVVYGFFEFILFYFTILLSIFISKYYDLKLIETVISINIVFLFLMTIYLLSRYFYVIKKSIKIKTIRTHVKAVYLESYHFVLSTSIFLISTALVYKIIRLNYSTETLGAYDTILKFSQIIVLPLVATNGRVMVSTSKHFFANELDQLRAYIIKITKMLAITSTACAIVSAIAFFIFSYYFKTSIKEFWGLFLLLSLAQLINNWAGPAETVLQVTNNIKAFNKVAFIATLYLVISTYITTEYFDIEVVGINMIIYMFIFNFASLIILKKRLGINIYKI